MLLLLNNIRAFMSRLCRPFDPGGLPPEVTFRPLSGFEPTTVRFGFVLSSVSSQPLSDVRTRQPRWSLPFRESEASQPAGPSLRDPRNPPKVTRSLSELAQKSISSWHCGHWNHSSQNSENDFFVKSPGRLKLGLTFCKPSYDNPFDSLHTWSWFVGSMSRDDASRKLEMFQDGTFLVRVSQSESRRGEYALSIKYGRGHPVKHIKIQKNHEEMFYIADCKMFRSIPDLVQYYQKNSLQPSFSEVPTTLQVPYKDALEESGVIGHCIATYEYFAKEPNQLTLMKGDLIAILSQAADSRGWWKGSLNGKVGYFPSAFVAETDEDGRPFH